MASWEKWHEITDEAEPYTESGTTAESKGIDHTGTSDGVLHEVETLPVVETEQ